MQSRFSLDQSVGRGVAWRGVKKDTTEALRLLEAAAAQGHAKAQSMASEFNPRRAKPWDELASRVSCLPIWRMPLDRVALLRSRGPA